MHPIIKWYHKQLNHSGMMRLNCTIVMHFYQPHLKHNIEQFVQNCDVCQRFQLNNVQYGELPQPWQEVSFDLIGTWKVQYAEQELIFNVLTCIDTVTNLVELICINNHPAAHVAKKLEDKWLSRYPQPDHLIHDPGSEFTEMSFANMLWYNGMTHIPEGCLMHESHFYIYM